MTEFENEESGSETSAFYDTVRRHLPTVATMLEADEHAEALAALVYGQVELFHGHYDNWNGGTDFHTLSIALAADHYARIRKGVNEIARQIDDALAEAVGGWDHDIISVRIKALPIDDPDESWKVRAAERLTGRGLTNQGRVRSDNPAALTYQGLLFRSKAEINLFKAFARMDVAVAPLPVFVRGGAGKGSRFEPDFLVIHGSKVMVVEVDGPTTHTERPVEAHERLAILSRQSVHVERVKAEDCSTFERAEALADKLLTILRGLK